jgi:hypothetical protein
MQMSLVKLRNLLLSLIAYFLYELAQKILKDVKKFTASYETVKS